ncbi:MAG: hypothetical protein K2X08_05235 [Chlamydiales bacterium]|nr:hypothetical protein [Chlamydiales bacterium]
MTEEKKYSKQERAILNRSVNEVVDALEREMKEKFGLGSLSNKQIAFSS